MNKKFFGALTGAAILLSQGSPILAQEMIEVESGSVPGTDVEQASTVVLNDINFPDTNFRNAVGLAYAKQKDSTATSPVADGTKMETSTLADITNLVTSGASDSAYSTVGGTVTYLGFKDLTGIEYLTGLQVLDLQNSPQLKVADLSANEELITVVIAPTSISVAGSPNFEITLPITSAGANKSDLYSITLPEETANLTNLVIESASQLTSLDLSAYDGLDVVDLQDNELAQLNVEGCTSITDLNVSGNDLIGLDVSTLKSLDTLTASDNNLYEVEFPSGKTLTKVDLSDNKLATLDVSGLKNLDDLNVSENRLESIDLSNNKLLTTLNVSYNHLASLDLTAQDSSTLTLTLGDQYLYANTDDAGIDLSSYDENFQASSNGLGYVNDTANTPSTSPIGGTITKAGVFEFDSDITPASGSTGISYEYEVGDGYTDKMTVNIVQADLMNRLYNPNSGEHFYTKDLNEKDTLVKLGWQYEGIGWVAPQENYPTVSVEAGEAVFRLYNPNAGDHHYTKDSKEKDVLVRAGWNYEGVGWYSAKEHKDHAGATPDAYSIEVYREYNPNAKEAGSHNYTTSENENDTLVALGWLDEGIGWWALK